jgi:hypothetical protein
LWFIFAGYLRLWHGFRRFFNAVYFILTTALNPAPLFILPLLEKIGFAQWRMTFMPDIGLMMPGSALEILLVSIITRKTAHKLPERFELA